MSDQWAYQIRIYLDDAHAEIARSDPADRRLKPLTDILDRHQAKAVSQFDAFAKYVAEAERQGPENFPLYKWTKATVDDPEKKRKHIGTFALHAGGREVYDRDVADALEADVQGIVGGGLVLRLSRHDTNPANNLPVPAEFRS